jgi:hypothetical protein
VLPCLIASIFNPTKNPTFKAKLEEKGGKVKGCKALLILSYQGNHGRREK